MRSRAALLAGALFLTLALPAAARAEHAPGHPLEPVNRAIFKPARVQL